MKVIPPFSQTVEGSRQPGPTAPTGSTVLRQASPHAVATPFPAPRPSTDRAAESSTTLEDLSDGEKLALAKRLTAALDDVLEAAADEAQISTEEWDQGQQEFFTDFTRRVLTHGMLAHDEARECGANDRNLPFLQLLFGLPPAMEASVGADGDLDPLVALAGPFQNVIGDRVDDDDTYIRAQKSIYSDIDAPF